MRPTQGKLRERYIYIADVEALERAPGQANSLRS
jgi:hypothetical protein